MDDDRMFLRCASCAKGIFGPSVATIDESVVAAIVPCGEAFERPDGERFECPGPKIWRRKWQA